jgi:palmitoyltransferase ZDHHC9/14/18
VKQQLLRHHKYQIQRLHHRKNKNQKKYSNKIYNNWPADNSLCCHGHLWFGPDRKLFILTIILILIPTGAFPGQVWPYFILNQNVAFTIVIIIVSVVGFLIVMGSLLVTATVDPGIIPRKHLLCGNVYSYCDILMNANGEKFLETDLGKQQQLMHTEFGNKFFPPLFQQVLLNDEIQTLKYCYTCQVYRPPRCSHCPRCDNCVEKFDHHCPWTGTCIGKGNYRFFYLFVTSTTFMCLFVMAISIVQCVLVSIEEYANVPTYGFGPCLGNVLKRCPAAILLIIYLFFALTFVGSLCLFHTYLILTNQTTYETIKKKNKFAFSRGLAGNLVEFFCKNWSKKLDTNASIPLPLKLDVELYDLPAVVIDKV